MLRTVLRGLIAAGLACLGSGGWAESRPDVAGPSGPSLLCMEPPAEQARLVTFPPGEPVPKHGVVVRVRMDFTDGLAAPAVEVVRNSGSQAYADAVLARVKAYRLACTPGFPAPTILTQEFQFVPGDLPQVISGRARRLVQQGAGASRFVYMDEPEPAATALTLQHFLGGVDRLTEQRVRFDFTTKGCPFKVRWTYLQPHARNGVDQPVSDDIHKREFVAWLRDVTFKPALTANNKLVDRSFSIDVPCVVLDLL